MRPTKALRVNDADVVKDDVLEGHDRRGHGAAGRAAVRGPDQGDARHAAGPRVVRKVVAAELKKFLTSTKRAEKAQARLVMEKVVAASQDPTRGPAAA